MCIIGSVKPELYLMKSCYIFFVFLVYIRNAKQD